MAKRFTRAELEAIEEALIFRSAGEMGDEACPADDYERALAKIGERLAKLPARPEEREA